MYFLALKWGVWPWNEDFLYIILALGCYLTKAHRYYFEHDNNSNLMRFYVFYDIVDVEGLEIKADL